MIALLLAGLTATALAGPLAPGGEVALPLNDYRALLQQIENQKDAQKDVPAPPRAWTLDRAVYTGRVVGTGESQHVVFTARLQGQVLASKGWSTIPLLSTEAALRSAVMDGKDASIAVYGDNYALLTNRPGPFSVTLEFAVKLSTEDGETGLTLPLMASGATELSLTVESPDEIDIVVPSAEGVRYDRAPGKTTVSAVIPSTRPLALSWQRAVKEVKPEAKPVARVYEETQLLVGVSEGNLLQCNASLNYTVINGEVDRFRFQLPKDAAILDVEGPGIRDWSVQDGVVTVFLNYGATGSYKLAVNYEQTLSGALPVPNVLDVAREKGWVGVDARSAVEVLAGKAAGAVAVDVKELPPEILGKTDFPVLLAFKSRGDDVQIPLEVRAHPDVEMLVTLLDVAYADTLITPDGRRMTHIQYAVRNNRNQFLKLKLPEGAEVWSASVGGKSVKVAQGEGGGVLIPLVRSDYAGGALAAFPVDLVYVEKGGGLEKGSGELTLSLPKANAPTSQVQWSVYVPPGMEVKKKTRTGTLQPVDYFSRAPQLPVAAVPQQAARQMNAEAAAVAAGGGFGQGVDPVNVTLPLTGSPWYFEKVLALDETLSVGFDYKYKPK